MNSPIFTYFIVSVGSIFSVILGIYILKLVFYTIRLVQIKIELLNNQLNNLNKSNPDENKLLTNEQIDDWNKYNEERKTNNKHPVSKAEYAALIKRMK